MIRPSGPVWCLLAGAPPAGENTSRLTTREGNEKPRLPSPSEPSIPWPVPMDGSAGEGKLLLGFSEFEKTGTQTTGKRRFVGLRGFFFSQSNVNFNSGPRDKDLTIFILLYKPMLNKLRDILVNVAVVSA